MKNTLEFRTRRTNRGRNAIVQFISSSSPMFSRWLLVLVAILSTLHGHVYAEERPNVLFWISDDLNNSLGC